jgi:site-specific DNA recombinase
MIKNTTYKGINRYGKNRDTTIQRTVPPIVPEEVWQKAQEVLSANKVKIKGNVKKNYLLRGLLKCAHCGYSFSGAFTGKYVYYSDIGRYAWRSHRLEKKCIGKTLPQKWVEDTVWESCMTYIRDPQLVVKSAKSRDNSEELEKEIALIRAKIAHNGVENQRLIDLYKAGLISLEAVTGEFEKVKAEKDMLQKQLDQLEYDLRTEKDMHDVSSTISDLEQMQQLLESPTLDFDVKKTVVDTMIEKVLVDSIAETITIHFAFGDTVTHKIVFKKKPR